jgi:hypothetical protein
MKPPSRWKDSDEIDLLTRELLSSARPTRPIPETHRMRGARRVAKLASAPVVALGFGLVSKAAAAGFALGAVSAVAVVATVPAVRTKLLAPTMVAPSPLVGAEFGLRGAPTPPAPADPPAIEADPTSFGGSSPSASVEPPTLPKSALGVPSLRSDQGLRTDHSVAHRRSIAAPSADRATAPPEKAPEPTDSAAATRATGNDRAMSAEVAALIEARRQIEVNPAAALETLERHAGSFPSGSLAMERDVLIVEALARSGRRREAVRRAWDILAKAPNAFYAARLKQLIEQDSAR